MVDADIENLVRLALAVAQDDLDIDIQGDRDVPTSPLHVRRAASFAELKSAIQLACVLDSTESGGSLERLQAWWQDCVTYAKNCGYVVTVEQVPLKPLAMGHYKSVVTVQRRRR